MSEEILTIEFDYLENAYIDNLGNVYKTIDNIPEEYKHLVVPIKEIKAIATSRFSRHQSS